MEIPNPPLQQRRVIRARGLVARRPDEIVRQGDAVGPYAADIVEGGVVRAGSGRVSDVDLVFGRGEGIGAPTAWYVQ